MDDLLNNRVKQYEALEKLKASRADDIGAGYVVTITGPKREDEEREVLFSAEFDPTDLGEVIEDLRVVTLSSLKRLRALAEGDLRDMMEAMKAADAILEGVQDD